MLVSNHNTRRPLRRVATTSRVTPQTGAQTQDQVTLGGQPKHETKSSKLKFALIAGATGAVIGAIGGAIGGPVGGIAAAPVVGLIGGVAAASAFKFSKSGEDEEKATAEKHKLLLRTASAGLVGAAVVGLGVAGGVVGAVAAGVGGLATGAAMGYGLGA